MDRELTGKQKKALQNHAKGMDKGEAYIKAGYKCKSNAVGSAAMVRLLKNVKAKSYLDGLLEQATSEAVLTIREKREYLASLVRTPVGHVDLDSPLAQEVQHTEDGTKIKMPDKLRALDLDSKLAGDYAPVEVEVTNSLLDQIRGA